MQGKIPPVKPEKPKQTPEITPKPSASGKTLIPALLVVILVLAGIILFIFQRFTALPVAKPRPTENVTGTPESVRATPITAEWKTYTNTEAGFSLKYPDSVFLNDETEGVVQPVLFVGADKLSSIPEDLPMLMGRTDALKEKDLLAKGEGENLVKIGSLNGQVRMTLAQFEVCSVILTRSLTFYLGDYRVIISLAGPKTEIINSMPDFFTIDNANCGSKRIWKQDKIATFEPTLAQKKGQGAGQVWYDTFDAIVKTITLTTPSNTVPSPSNNVNADLLTYKNNTYGFEISYPKSYKALDNKDALSGYPQGVVLLYSGGQAYDVVIEVWNTEAEYKEKYATMMSDVTVVKSNGKFITLLDSTHQSENAQIIASFKLLSN